MNIEIAKELVEDALSEKGDQLDILSKLLMHIYGKGWSDGREDLREARSWYNED